jgi:hypothetical protein
MLLSSRGWLLLTVANGPADGPAILACTGSGSHPAVRFQAGHIPSHHATCEYPRVLPIADGCHWLMPLLSAQLNESLGLWAKWIANTSSIIAGVSRRMSMPAVHD